MSNTTRYICLRARKIKLGVDKRYNTVFGIKGRDYYPPFDPRDAEENGHDGGNRGRVKMPHGWPERYRPGPGKRFFKRALHKHNRREIKALIRKEQNDG